MYHYRGAIGLALLAAGPVFAATRSAPPDGTPALSPPYAELPPSFMEQYGGWLALAGVALLALAGLAAWWRWRPRPPEVIPPEVQARQELLALSRQTQDGRALSRVSRSLRRYLTVAFGLPPEEMTTAEFCRAAAASENLGPELAAQSAEFLRRCDQLKFAPSNWPPPPGAAEQALTLVELGEARRALRRQAATDRQPVPPA